MLITGCVGFPVGRDRYWRTLSFVEARTGEVMPRESTLLEWRAGAPAGADFAVQAYRLITHGREDRGFPPAGRKLTPARQLQCGGFRESVEVYEGWQATKNAAALLKAKMIVFETPASFQPGPDRLRDLYRFFKKLPPARVPLVWHPLAREWNSPLGDKVCAELGLVRSFDPLQSMAPKAGAFRYARPQGPRSGGFFDKDLSAIRAGVEGKPSYLVFSHRMAFPDASRVVTAPRIS